MKTFISKNAGFILGYIFLIGLMIFGTFYDLELSKTLVNLDVGEYYSKNLFLQLTEVFAEMPIYPICSVAAFLVLRYLNGYIKAPRSVKIAVCAFVSVAAVGLNYFGSYHCVKYFRSIMGVFSALDKTGKILTYLATSITVTALCAYLASLFDGKNLKSLAICSLIVIFTAILSQVGIHFIKHFAGRARYRLLTATDDFSLYTPWYVFKTAPSAPASIAAIGGEDCFHSFPSGHTASASITFALLSLLTFIPDMKTWKRIVVACIGVGYPVFVGTVRLLMGAHFLTDVTFAALLTLTCYLVVLKLIPFVINRIKVGKRE